MQKIDGNEILFFFSFSIADVKLTLVVQLFARSYLLIRVKKRKDINHSVAQARAGWLG